MIELFLQAASASDEEAGAPNVEVEEAVSEVEGDEVEAAAAASVDEDAMPPAAAEDPLWNTQQVAA